MSNLDRVIKELGVLRDEGSALLDSGQKDDLALGDFGPLYERWYTKALAAVTQVAPERLPEFKEAYRHETRKRISYETYTIADFLLGLRVSRDGEPVFDTTQAFAVKLLRQIGIVCACVDLSSSVLRDIRSSLRSEILDDDVNAARALFRAGHLRSAGVVCGVVLEAHLQAVCERRSIRIAKKDPGIGDLNELLKAGCAYDIPTWRLIQRLADIRNLCGHKKDREPKADEVEDLISGTDKIIKCVA